MIKRNPYVRPMTATWWMQHGFYRFYILREASSLFVSGYALFLLFGLYSLTQGPSQWERFVGLSQSISLIIVNLCCLAMISLHSVTWFKLTPKTMELTIAGKTMREEVLVSSQFVLFALVSVVLILIIGGWL